MDLICLILYLRLYLYTAKSLAVVQFLVLFLLLFHIFFATSGPASIAIKRSHFYDNNCPFGYGTINIEQGSLYLEECDFSSNIHATHRITHSQFYVKVALFICIFLLYCTLYCVHFSVVHFFAFYIARCLL